MGAIALLGAAAMLGFGGWRAARALRQPTGWPRLLAACVLAWIWLTIGLQLLGGVGLLNRSAVLAWSAGGVLIAVALRSKQAYPALAPERWGVAATLVPRSFAFAGKRRVLMNFR